MLRTLPVKITEGQVKKHVLQMSNKEKDYLATTLDNVSNKVRKTYHSNNRIDTDTIGEDIYTIILKKKNFDIVEYNLTRGSRRVLIRDKYVLKNKTFHKGGKDGRVVKGDVNLCFVIDIDSGEIVTSYYNFARDNHPTIDEERYDKTLFICA